MVIHAGGVWATLWCLVRLPRQQFLPCGSIPS